MKKIDFKDLQLSSKVVTDLTGSLQPNDVCTAGNIGTCDTQEDDCNDETDSCDCGTDNCAGTQSGGEQCCYATIANASQCCITPPASHDVCLETIEDLCNQTTACNQTDYCQLTIKCYKTNDCEETEVNCYQPVETTLC